MGIGPLALARRQLNAECGTRNAEFGENSKKSDAVVGKCQNGTVALARRHSIADFGLRTADYGLESGFGGNWLPRTLGSELFWLGPFASPA